MKKLNFYIGVTITLAVISLISTSCEDDVIVEPADEEECTGSYCRIETNDSPRLAHLQQSNPELF